MTPPYKLCSICRKPIPYGSQYYLCSVSTCQRKRTGLFFCQLPCFEAHLPEARHRDAWAELETAPAGPSQADEHVGQAPPTRPSASGGSASSSDEGVEARRRRVATPADTSAPKDVLVVVSKLKKFIKESRGMNTSDSVVGPLSNHLRDLATAASEEAAQEGRKTVLDRDFTAVVRRLRSP